jgi:stage II sporulation protein AB (anti-sigma F factor)
VIIRVRDKGCGIEDIKQAMQPLYSGAGSEDRSGMGFSIMESFTDSLSVSYKVGKCTSVTMKKYIGTKDE